MGNRWCFNNKNVFATDRVVCVTTGTGQKPQNGQLKFFNLLISEHIKNKGIKNLFSKLRFYEVTFYVL